MATTAFVRSTRLSWLTTAPVIVAIALTDVAVMHYVYAAVVAPEFSYLRYEYRSPDPLYYAIAVAMVVVLALVMPRRIERPSQWITWVIFVITVVPSVIIPQIAPVLSPVDSIELAGWITGGFGLVAILGTRRGLRQFLPIRPLSQRSFWRLFLGLWAVMNAYLLLTVGVYWSLPSLDDVYGVRAALQTVKADNTVLEYSVSWLASFINAALMIGGLWCRRWLWLLAGLLGQLYMYDIDGDKTAVLSPIAVVLAYFLLRRPRPAGAAVLLAAPVLSVMSMAVDLVFFHSTELTSLIARRVFITPGLVSTGWVEVFSNIDKAKLGHSVLRWIFPYPYPVEPADLVGALFFDRPDTHANASFMADGYANFGYPGMVAACLILVALLWAIDDATRGLPAGFSRLLFLMPALTLAESGVLTAILTGGIMLAIVFCALAPRTGWPPVPGDRVVGDRVVGTGPVRGTQADAASVS
jgi:hypothetical protein